MRQWLDETCVIYRAYPDAAQMGAGLVPDIDGRAAVAAPMISAIIDGRHFLWIAYMLKMQRNKNNDSE